MRNIWVYDLEQSINFHSCAAINIDTKERKFFVIAHFRNNFEEYIEWLKSKGLILVGYNNLDFDYQLLHILLLWKDGSNIDALIKALYERTQVIVDNSTHRFAKELIPEWKMLIPQLDVYKINHLDNEAKRTSLKALEVAMRSESVQDIPFKHYEDITQEMLPIVEQYNFNDVENTMKYLLEYCLPAIQLRKDISTIYGINVMNANDIKIGVEIFAKELSRDMNIPIKDLRQLKTERKGGISLSECILDKVKFRSKSFNAIKDFFSAQHIYETNSVFNGIPTNKLGNVWNYCAKNESDYTTEPGRVKTKKLVKVKKGVEVLEKLNIIYKGFQYDFGTGGLHGCIRPGIYLSDNELTMVDIDISSDYPNIAINNKFRPAHLGESFCRVYKDIYERRKVIPKSNPNNAAYKLALNGVFGKSNEKSSWLYDPAFLVSITINGQLLLCMLAEAIVDFIPDVIMLQANTDGLTVKIKRTDYDRLMKICKQWESYTSLELEYAEYKKMIIKHVNSYIGEYTDPNKIPKYKGEFQIDREIYKNHSKRVVRIALSNYFLHNIPVAQTIRQHINGAKFGNYENYGIYDYCISKKATGSWYYQAIIVDGDRVNAIKHDGKVFRYFVSNKGAHYVKTNGDSSSQVEAHPQKGRTYYLTSFNKYFYSEIYDIDYSYYIRECNKIIEIIQTNQLEIV